MSNFLLVQTLNGLSFAALLFLLSSGLSLIYGVMKIVNIAHGSFFMVGAYVALSVILKTNNFFLGALAGGLAVGVLGFIIERGFLRRFPLQPLPQMMITLGFALLIRDLSLLIWGGDPYILPCPEYLKGSVKIFDVVFPIYRIFIFFVAIVVAIALWLFNEKTLVGAKLRAAVDDHEMAGGVGLNVPLISGCMFGLGAFLAGFGGVMGGPIFGVYPGLDILLGYTGLSSFGHAGFFGVAGYVAAILSTRYNMGFLFCLISGVSLSVLIGMIFGFLVAHATGVYFLIITLALGMVLWGLAFRWVSMTGGDNGISGIIRPDIGLPIALKDPLTFYYVIFVFFLIALILMAILIRSPFGHSLKGIRESESRMRVLGYHSWLHKYLAYVMSAAFAGFAGVFWAYFNGFISPFDMDLNASIEIVLMVILGGPGTLIGPALGAGIIVFLKNFISAYTQRWLLILGTIYILTILYAPQGLVNFLKDWVRERQGRTCGKNGSNDGAQP